MDPIELAKQMAKDGASTQEIISALEELGIENPAQILAKISTIQASSLQSQSSKTPASSSSVQKSQMQSKTLQRSEEETGKDAENEETAYESEDEGESLFEDSPKTSGKTTLQANKAKQASVQQRQEESEDDAGQDKPSEGLFENADTNPAAKAAPVPYKKAPQKIEENEEENKDDESEIGKLQITSVSQEGSEKTVDLESMLSKQNSQNNDNSTGTSANTASFDNAKIAELERKIDNLVALTKALQDVNKKILDAERENLLRKKS